MRIETLRDRIEGEINAMVEAGDLDTGRLDILDKWYDIQDTADFKELTRFYRAFKAMMNRPVLNHTMASPQDDRALRKRLMMDIPFCESNPDYFDALRDEQTKLISGGVQGGKSAAICGTAIYAIKSLGIPVIILLRCYDADSKQLFRSMTDTYGDYNTPTQYAKKAKESDIFLREPRVTITIEHQTQLKRIVDALEHYQQIYQRTPKFLLITDEADAVAYKKYSDRIRHQLFQKIKSTCSQYIGVTATAFDMLLLENSLNNYSIFHVPVVPSYRGIRDFVVKQLRHDFEFKLTEDGDIPYDMINFYRIFVSKGVSETHPPICLQKTQTVIQNQLQFLELITECEVGRQMTTIVYNGNGVYVSSPYTPFNCDIDGDRPRRKDAGYTHYRKLNVADILQFLKDAGIIRPILIISGHIVSRGVNVVSRDYEWHLTHEILQVSNSASCSDIVQACRLCGIYNDNYPLTLYIRAKDAKILQQTCDLQDRLFEGASIHELTEQMPTLCEQIKVFKDHIPRRSVSKKCKPHFNRVNTKSRQYLSPTSTSGMSAERRLECMATLEKNTGSASLVRGLLTDGPMSRRELQRLCKELYGIYFNPSMLRSNHRKYNKHGPLLRTGIDPNGCEMIYPHTDYEIVAEEMNLLT